MILIIRKVKVFVSLPIVLVVEEELPTVGSNYLDRLRGWRICQVQYIVYWTLFYQLNPLKNSQKASEPNKEMLFNHDFCLDDGLPLPYMVTCPMYGVLVYTGAIYCRVEYRRVAMCIQYTNMPRGRKSRGPNNWNFEVKRKSQNYGVKWTVRGVCVCVFSSHSFWTSSLLDVPAGVTQEEGHTGFSIHLPSAVRALIFVARRIQPFLSLVDREVEFCVLTN